MKKMTDYKFYDTCALLQKVDTLFTEEENIVISSITLQELENIKTSNHKDAEIKYASRKLLHLLDENTNYNIVIYKEEYIKPIVEAGLEISNDTKILACALWFDRNVAPDETIFVTNDLALKAIANLFFGEDSIESVKQDRLDDYQGYEELTLSEDELIKFYSNPSYNMFDLYINEYLIIHNEDGEIIDRLCWTGNGYRHLDYQSFRSKHFGDIKPKSGDVYQQLAFDSLNNNQITMIKGPAGSGKTLCSLGYLFSKLEKGKIDKIIVFCNTVATHGAAKLGFYPGTRDEKLLDSQIGNLLASKLGDRTEVERLIRENQLLLLPLSDVRGFDTTGMRAGVYISEAQNMDVALMKLALQRIDEDSICIIDGDYKQQLDDINFAGTNNGMRRVSQIFKGQDFYGEVELQNIHRSRIGRIAELM